MSGTPILAVNCGSSSLKFGLYSAEGDAIRLLCEGEGEEIGKPGSSFWFMPGPQADRQTMSLDLPDHKAALARALQVMKESGASLPEAAGHRIVHGGRKVRSHQKLTPQILSELREAVEFAPLHVPPALASLDAVSEQLPGLPQVICLDNAFHADMPDVSRLFALPPQIAALGVERYGFHGLSLESILPQLNPIPSRLVVAHLGGGCSVTAIRNGKSVDTTMGLTPTGGMMMATRCGDLDPGVMLFLLRNDYDIQKLEQLVDHDSGLLGVSQVSSDLRKISEVRRTRESADLALRMFTYQLRKAISAMAAAAGGLDLLVFTGGIGEHDAGIRDQVSGELHFLGPFRSLALPSKEDEQIAVITARLL